MVDSGLNKRPVFRRFPLSRVRWHQPRLHDVVGSMVGKSFTVQRCCERLTDGDSVTLPVKTLLRTSRKGVDGLCKRGSRREAGRIREPEWQSANN